MACIALSAWLHTLQKQWLHHSVARSHTKLRFDYGWSSVINCDFCYNQFMKKNPLIDYSLQLATEIEFLCKSLKSENCSNIIFQIKKSSSSVYANVSEAQYPQSLPDMLSKLIIARKECSETESWLTLLQTSNYIDDAQCKRHRSLSGRIRRLLTASCITIERKCGK